MANAKKCDRCGTFYIQPVNSDIRVVRYEHGYGDQPYDLCDECTAKLDRFLAGADVCTEYTLELDPELGRVAAEYTKDSLDVLKRRDGRRGLV